MRRADTHGEHAASCRCYTCGDDRPRPTVIAVARVRAPWWRRLLAWWRTRWLDHGAMLNEAEEAERAAWYQRELAEWRASDRRRPHPIPIPGPGVTRLG